MNIIGGKITISKAKRHLGCEITAADENTSDVSSPKAPVIPVSCHPSKGGDVQSTVTMETPGKPESCRLDSDPSEDAVTSKVIEKLMSEMLDQCVDEADLTDVASVFSVVAPVGDSKEKLKDERTVDQGRVAPCNGDRPGVPRTPAEVSDGPGVAGTLAEVASTEGNGTETKELTDLDSECDMFGDNPDFEEEVHRDNTDGHFFLHSGDASAEDYARVPSPSNSIRNSKASACAEQMPNVVTSNVTGLVLQEQTQTSYAEIEGSVGVMQYTTAPPGVVVEGGKVSVVFNSSIPCEEATAVLNDDINGSIVNGEDDILPNDKSFSSHEECNTVSKCKFVPMPNSESTMIDKGLVLPSEDITFSGGECVGSWEDGETLDGDEDDVNLLVEYDAELGIISIDSRVNSRKNEPEVSVSSLCENNEITTTATEEVTGESSEASIDVPQTAPHCHLYFL